MRLNTISLYHTYSSLGCSFLFQQWNQLSRFQRNILYFAVITVILVIFYLLPSETKAGTSDEVDYNNVEVVQETAKYEKVHNDERRFYIRVEKDIESFFILQAVDEVVVDNDEQGAGPGEVIEEPEFQPEINQVDDDQIGEPPQPKPNILKFNGRL